LGDRHKELLELLDKSGTSLFSLLTRLTLREETAEELMQELFIKLSNSRGFEKSHNRNAYARRAAINLAFDWRRKFRQKNTQPAAFKVVTDNNSPLNKIIRSEELEGMLNAIGKLNKNWRQAIVMRHIQQLSYDEISEHLGKTPHHARALCSKALNRLREIMGTDNHKISSKEIGNV
jgi:RNA polymerase sigma-70 factor (ECF subfamily)